METYIASSTVAGASFNEYQSMPTTDISEEGDYSILTKESDGTFTRRLKDGTTIRYNASRPDDIKDRQKWQYLYIHT